MARGPLTLLLTFALLPAALAQHKAPPAYGDHDILSPFRKCNEIYAPPDAVFQELRIMRARAEREGASLHFDSDGREVCDDQLWTEARNRLRKLRLDPGYLAEILRRSRNADERDLALYGTFLCADPAAVFNLISHIPGEPNVQTRQKAYPRAIAFLKAHIGRQWGGLSDDEKKTIDLPPIGSPAAKAAGLTREPADTDFLYTLRLQPFFQLLDLDTPLDQAQGLWFLKECFLIRKDLAKGWLEPALPRLRELLVSDEKIVREQAIGVLAVLAPKLPAPRPDDAISAIASWGEQAIRIEFPPVRVVSEGLVLLWPCEERETMAKAAVDALRNGGSSDAINARTSTGQAYRGLRITRVPKGLEALPIKVGMVITMLNGTPVNDASQLLELCTRLLKPKDPDEPVRGRLYFEYVLGDQSKALEVRVM
jgi:hypothetical protein